MITSSPNQKSSTDVLKVDIDCSKTSFSINHSISQSPSNDSSYNNNIPNSYPNTPIILNNISYTHTNTPANDKLHTHELITPTTPVTPNNHSNSSVITPVHTDSYTHQSAKKDQFPDTIAVKRPNNIALAEIDEKKVIKTVKKEEKPKKKECVLMDGQSIDDKLQCDTLRKHGYKKSKFIADTLQGCTFVAQRMSNGESVVIKCTAKHLYARGITISKEGKAFNIKEDIVAEGQMMRHFMAHSPPSSLISFYDFFEDSHQYYLVMEHGGQDFFDFVVKCHELINDGKLAMKEWRKQCKFMFAQIVQCIKWLHTRMSYCHLDISLENILISNEAHFDAKSGKLQKCYVKFIDFGLAQHFDMTQNPFFLSKKYVGKTHYKSPKVYGKKEQFMANKADIWSLGVCLFMMIIGAPPYNRPTEKDPGYRFIKEQKITKLLYSWNRIKYVTPNLYDLMERMLCVDENKRIGIHEIVRHDWLKVYFPNERVPVMHSPRSHSSQQFPLSPSLSAKMSNSFSQTLSTGAHKSMNIMLPQQAASMSHSYSKSPNAKGQNRKASSSFQYKRTQYRSPIQTRRNTNSSNLTPTPIIESHTKDTLTVFAAVDSANKEREANKENKAQNSVTISEENIVKESTPVVTKDKKKKKKKFFKLSLSIFGSKTK